MNDRALGLLEKYDIEVNKTWKGRGSFLCDTSKGLLIFKEYTGSKERVLLQNKVLEQIKEKGFLRAEEIIADVEGNLLVFDRDEMPYILKTYCEGRECNIFDHEEAALAMKTLAELHKVMAGTLDNIYDSPPKLLMREFEKHNRELKKVHKFLKERGQKSDFEMELLSIYDYFKNYAFEVTDNFASQISTETDEEEVQFVCHGDFQHHNLLICTDGMRIINFEKCVADSPVRDLYLFLRKVLEKTEWETETGVMLIDSYLQERELSKSEKLQLYYRLAYPEKFWKVVNFYYNSGKAWIPGKNIEKLERLSLQEKERLLFLKNYQMKYI